MKTRSLKQTLAVLSLISLPGEWAMARDLPPDLPPDAMPMKHKYFNGADDAQGNYNKIENYCRDLKDRIDFQSAEYTRRKAEVEKQSCAYGSCRALGTSAVISAIGGAVQSVGVPLGLGLMNMNMYNRGLSACTSTYAQYLNVNNAVGMPSQAPNCGLGGGMSGFNSGGMQGGVYPSMYSAGGMSGMYPSMYSAMGANSGYSTSYSGGGVGAMYGSAYGSMYGNGMYGGAMYNSMTPANYSPSSGYGGYTPNYGYGNMPGVSAFGNFKLNSGMNSGGGY